MNLYELPAAYAAWEHAVDQAGGEVTPKLEAALEEIESNFAVKVDAVAALVRGAEVEAAAIRAEIARLADRARACDRRGVRLRTLLLDAMKAAHADSWKSGRFRISVRRAAVPTIRWAGIPEAIPTEWTRVQIERDSAKLLAHWKDTGTVPPGFTASFADVLQIR